MIYITAHKLQKLITIIDLLFDWLTTTISMIIFNRTRFRKYKIIDWLILSKFFEYHIERLVRQGIIHL